MLPEKRMKYVKGLLTTAAKALDGYTLSKEQFDEMFAINGQLWARLSSFEQPQPPVVVEQPVEEVKSEETSDANV
jgi:hypothetical protein